MDEAGTWDWGVHRVWLALKVEALSTGGKKSIAMKFVALEEKVINMTQAGGHG